MRHRLSQRLPLVLAVLLASSSFNDASISLDRIWRRQAGESEQESTTPKQENAQPAPGGANNGQSQSRSQPPRLYPDLPRQPNFLPPFNAPPGNNFPASPYVPFGVQMPPLNRLNADQQPAPFGRMPVQPRFLKPAERLQSQSFADGLGRRLLSMVGINTAPKDTQPAPSDATNSSNTGTPNEALQALQNATILQQLNKGVHSIYGGLSKLYNSTVREQLQMLQEGLKADTANSTNPWRQRMAQQVPVFFQQMANRVNQAQEQLNRVWQDIAQANKTGTAGGEQSRSIFGSLDQFLRPPGDTEFFNQFGGPFGGPSAADRQAGPADQQRDMVARVRELWQNQIQPQIGLVRNEMARAWRDLVASGAFQPSSFVMASQDRSRSGSSANTSSDLVDSILKDVDMASVEYALVEPRGDNQAAASTDSSASGPDASQRGAQQEQPGLKLSPQMQDRLVRMQRELNQLWAGLTSSLQNTIATLNRQRNEPAGANVAEASERRPVEAENEISDKIKDMAKLQRNADLVHDTLQQQQREAQQFNSLGERFKGFLNSGLDGVSQLPDRIGDQFNRFGSAVGNFWNRLPEHWDSFVSNGRNPQEARPGMAGGSSRPSATGATS